MEKFLFDKRKSILTGQDINQCMNEITKIENNSICGSLSTMQVVKIGIEWMKSDDFRLVKKQLNV